MDDVILRSAVKRWLHSHVRGQLVETMASVDIYHFGRVERKLLVRIDRNQNGSQEGLKKNIKFVEVLK